MAKELLPRPWGVELSYADTLMLTNSVDAQRVLSQWLSPDAIMINAVQTGIFQRRGVGKATFVVDPKDCVIIGGVSVLPQEKVVKAAAQVLAVVAFSQQSLVENEGAAYIFPGIDYASRQPREEKYHCTPYEPFVPGDTVTIQAEMPDTADSSVGAALVGKGREEIAVISNIHGYRVGIADAKTIIQMNPMPSFVETKGVFPGDIFKDIPQETQAYFRTFWTNQLLAADRQLAAKGELPNRRGIELVIEYTDMLPAIESKFRSVFVNRESSVIDLLLQTRGMMSFAYLDTERLLALLAMGKKGIDFAFAVSDPGVDIPWRGDVAKDAQEFVGTDKIARHIRYNASSRSRKRTEALLHPQLPAESAVEQKELPPPYTLDRNHVTQLRKAIPSMPYVVSDANLARLRLPRQVYEKIIALHTTFERWQTLQFPETQQPDEQKDYTTYKALRDALLFIEECFIKIPTLTFDALIQLVNEMLEKAKVKKNKPEQM